MLILSKVLSKLILKSNDRNDFYPTNPTPITHIGIYLQGKERFLLTNPIPDQDFIILFLTETNRGTGTKQFDLKKGLCFHFNFLILCDVKVSKIQLDFVIITYDNSKKRISTLSKMSELKQVKLNADVYLVCLEHALSTENYEVMGLLIGDVSSLYIIIKSKCYFLIKLK